jgi:hypothetical protein
VGANLFVVPVVYSSFKELKINLGMERPALEWGVTRATFCAAAALQLGRRRGCLNRIPRETLVET